jgi:hypothetical protein
VNAPTRIALIGSAWPKIPSGGTFKYLAQFVDETGSPIVAADLSTLTLSIVDTISGAIVNGVDGVNVLNQGRGAIDANGNLTVTLGLVADRMDTVLLNASDQAEQRSIVLNWTWNGGTEAMAKQVDFLIIAMPGT